MRRLRSLLLWCLVALCAAVVTLYASASFPTAVKSFTTKASGDTIQAAHINDIQDEIVAIETALLTGPHPPIVFPATQDAESGANTLDDYEEGTWTPALEGATSESGQVYSSQVGSYVKVGRLVFCSGQIQLSTLGTFTGGINVTGLPFTVGGTPSAAGGFHVGQFANFTSSLVWLTGEPVLSTTTVTLQKLTAAATSTTAVTQADLSSTSLIRFGLTYITSQ